jgi:acetyltransferase-like isoleucine patch superfamily enzyme
MNLVNKVKRLLVEGDIKFFIFEKYSRIIGYFSIKCNQFIYGKRLYLEPPYKVWGRVQFMILGGGKIKIGKHFHCVSTRKRSSITLFSPCQLTIIGNAQIQLGDYVALNGTTISSRGKVTIGDNTMVGPNTIIMDNDGHVAWPPEDRWFKKGPVKDITIENNVWIGMNCIILKGVKIGHGSIVAAGSVVINDVEPNCVYAGNPAIKIKSLGV